MKILDNIYGEIEIKSQIIKDLIATKPFQRLKEINQYGGVNFIYKDKFQTSRYEHSIGVWYATYILGGDLEAQVAALLHDVGHFAFSHLVDAAKSSALENEHEFVRSHLDGWSEVEKILEKNNIELKDVDDYKLIKTSLPDIGTDRLDYALRDYECVVHEKDNFGLKALSDIEIFGSEITFKSLDVAKEYAKRGNKAMWYVIYDPQVAVVYHSISEILRDGLTDGWITDNDLLSTDKEVFEMFRAKQHEYGEKYFRIFTDPYKVERVSDKEDFDFRYVKLKARYFDPRVKTKSGDIKRVSELDSDFKKSLEEYVGIFDEAKTGVNLKIVF